MNTIESFYDRMYESQFDRNENIKIVECSHCNGNGNIYYSDCCGDEIVDGICQDIECLKPSVEVKEKCYDCNGEGEVESES